MDQLNPLKFRRGFNDQAVANTVWSSENQLEFLMACKLYVFLFQYIYIYYIYIDLLCIIYMYIFIYLFIYLFSYLFIYLLYL